MIYSITCLLVSITLSILASPISGYADGFILFIGLLITALVRHYETTLADIKKEIK